MKKIGNLFLLVLLIAVFAVICGATLYFLIPTLGGTIQVFDFANFLCTVVFSLAALGISIWELCRNRTKDKRMEIVRKNLTEVIDGKKEEIEAISQVCATDIIPDFPTYSNLPLDRLCKLYDEFHFKYSQTATKAMEDYLKSEKAALAIVIRKGEYLPESVIAMTISMIESVDRIYGELTHFKEIGTVHFWKIHVAEFSKCDEEKETLRKELYVEGNELCIAFNKLYADVLQNLEWFEVLCESMKA